MNIKKVAQRTSLPFDNRRWNSDPSISPATSKTTIPFNNVPTIRDIMDGGVNIRDVYPHAGGDWSPGEDVSKSYKEPGDDYKRREKDEQIIANMLDKGKSEEQQWKVKVRGGSKTFISFNLARDYVRENNLPFSYISRIAQAQPNKVGIIADSLNKTFLVKSIDTVNGVMETGSAFCVAPTYFITCAHVLKSYNKHQEISSQFFNDATVSLVQGGTEQRAVVINTDPKLDIALLKCNIDTEPLEIETAIMIGEEIVAIGSPHGYENNVSTGTLGSIGRKIYTYKGAPEYMFIDLSVFPGSSGGPVIKASTGKVVGMVTLIVSTGGSNYGLNAALPASYIQEFCRTNIKNFSSK